MIEIKKIEEKIQSWVSKRYAHLALFNLILLSLFLLRSAGYFHPFFEISVNLIVLVGVVLAVLLLGAKSQAIFLTSLIFWVFAFFLRYVKIEVWAERTAVYSYECLFIGVVMIIWENCGIFLRRK